MKQTGGSRRAWLAVAGLGVVVAVPLVVGLIGVREPPWVPVVDHAMTELRVRDTLSVHPPLVGLPGRIGTLDRQGSHPGPMSFYVMSPVYRLLGSTAWALQGASAAVHLAAAALALWIGYRRGGRTIAAGVGLVVVLLMLGFGVRAMLEPWNPYLPMLVWVVFLLAVWSVVDGDLPMLPVAAAAGTFCAQTHVSYVLLYASLAALALGASIGWMLDRPRGGPRRRAAGWLAVSAAVVVVLWLPPIIQQIRADPGNMSILADYFATPPEPPMGVSAAVRLVLDHLDVTYLLTQLPSPGRMTEVLGPAPNRAVGAAVLVVWLAAAGAATWLRHRRLVGLNLVVAVGLVAGLVSVSRIFGVPWYYLMLWLWGLGAVMALGIVWTACALIARRWPPPSERLRLAPVGFWALAAITVVVTARFVVDAAGVERPYAVPSKVITGVVPDVTRALEAGTGEAVGRDGRYLVEWSDSLNLGENGFGLFGELERNGFDVGVARPYGTQFGAQRVLDPADADAAVVLATGVNVDEWRQVPGAVEVAFVEPRTGSERQAYQELRQRIIDALRAEGAGDLVDEVDRNLFAVGLDGRLSSSTQLMLSELGRYGLPTAVFVAPPDAAVG
jgi:hypothetical protein